MSKTFRVTSIGERWTNLCHQLGIRPGDVIEAPDGFPHQPEAGEGLEPASLTRELHPNVAWFVGGAIHQGEIEVEEERPVLAAEGES